MRFKKPASLLLTTAALIILFISIEGFLPYFFIDDRGFIPGTGDMPVFSDDSRLVYVLQKAEIRQLLKADYDVAVVDPDDSGLSFKNLASLQKQGKKIIAYLSIGEAEDYRQYWKASWCAGTPCFIDEENPDWDGNYKVRFWDRQWQDIIYKRLDELVKTGYDGVYLDVVDAYQYYQCKGYAFAGIEMINFVYSISRRAKSVKEDFLIIPQNGEELSTDYIYLKSIDGVGREDIWFADDVPAPKAQTDLALKYLTGIKQNSKFVFVICYAKNEITKNKFLEFSKNYGFIPYLGNKELDTIEGF
jgi:cysteinyl-tRNA synthetase